MICLFAHFIEKSSLSAQFAAMRKEVLYDGTSEQIISLIQRFPNSKLLFPVPLQNPGKVFRADIIFVPTQQFQHPVILCRALFWAVSPLVSMEIISLSIALTVDMFRQDRRMI